MTLTMEISTLSANLSYKNTTTITNTNGTAFIPEGCLLKQISAFLPWDNKDNIVSKDVDTMINVLFSGIFLPLLFLVSCSTNMINTVVFYKHGLQERINLCLFTLSVLDMLSVTVAYGFNSDVLYMFLTGKAGGIGPAVVFFVRTYLVSLHAFIAASQVLSTIIALDRCLCITRPLLVKNLVSTKTTAVILWSIVVAIVGELHPGVGYRGSRPAPPLLRSRISPCSADRRVDSVPPRRLPHRLAFNQLVRPVRSP
ncbi:hypothetical protein ACOMHN_066744 [Nucella lapillus]